MKTKLKKAKKEVSFEFKTSDRLIPMLDKTTKKAMKFLQFFSRGNKKETYSLIKIVVIRQVVATFRNGKRIK